MSTLATAPRSMPGRAVFILGMHRSGTSMLAAVLRIAGVELGSDVMAGAVADNPRGYWESRELVRINDALLARLGLSWFVPDLLPKEYLDLPRVASLLRRATDFLRREFTAAPLWGIKDPRLCRLQGFWDRSCEELASEVRSVHIFRHPLEVADSLMARNQMPTEQALLLWLFHNLEAVLHRRMPPLTSVPMERLLADPVATVSRLQAALGFRDSLKDETRNEIRRFVEPMFRHHTAAADDPRTKTPLGTLATRCYECLERHTVGDDVRDELAALYAEAAGFIERRRHSLARPPREGVDVIVPVTDNGATIRRCVSSLRHEAHPSVVVLIHSHASHAQVADAATGLTCPP